MTASSSLCCCEYDNINGDRSHIMACCCDCEALDQTCDRLLTCKSVPPDTIERLITTMSDRCRIPWCSGKGAFQIKLDVIVPIIMIPSLLLIATLHFFMTIAVFTFIPIFILFFYTIWRRQGHRRTQFFFVWGLTSVLLSVFVFVVVIIPFREILLWEILLLASALLFMLYALYNAKKQPGYLGTVKKSQNKEIKYSQMRNGHIKTETKTHTDQDLLDIMSKEVHMEIENGMNETEITWVDSRPIKDGKIETVCRRCNIQRPPRSGHCTVCDICIAVRDHHCVWIDNCIGANNHRSFLLAMILFIFCGFYGSHLSLTTICTPTMVFDWILLPNDCRWMYADFGTSISFVTVCYSLISGCLMCLALFHQIILISQNLTSQELHQAWQRNLTFGWFFVHNNAFNQGILRNWLQFLLNRKRDVS